MSSPSTDLVICASPDTTATSLAAFLSEIAPGATTLTLAATPQDAQTALEGNAQARLCLICTAPEEALALLLPEAETSRTALEAWMSAARDMLGLQRRHRAHSLLFDTRHLVRFWAQGLARLELPGELSATHLPPLPAPDPNLQLIADRFIARTPAAKALGQELRASAQILSNDDDVSGFIPTDLALSAYLGLTTQLDEARLALQKNEIDAAQTETMLTEMRNAEAASQQAIAALAADLEKEQTAKAELAATIGDLKARQSASLAALQTDIGRLKDTNAALRRQKEHALETASQAETRLVAEIDRRQGLEEQLEEVRKARNTLAYQAAQLDSVKADAQAAHRANNALTARLSSAEAETRSARKAADALKASVDELEALRKKSAATIKQRNALLYRLKKLQEEHDNLRNSRTQRLTRPLRRLARVFRGK